jgi:hypothetical protein
VDKNGDGTRYVAGKSHTARQNTDARRLACTA